MTKSNDLFLLVKSLTPSEKRYMSLNSAQIDKGKNNYMKILEELENQAEYDENEIKRKFKNDKFVKRLPSEKIYLTNCVLKGMRTFHSEKN